MSVQRMAGGDAPLVEPEWERAVQRAMARVDPGSGDLWVAPFPLRCGEPGWTARGPSLTIMRYGGVHTWTLEPRVSWWARTVAWGIACLYAVRSVRGG